MRHLTERELSAYNRTLDSMSEKTYVLTEAEYLEMTNTIQELERKLIRANNVNQRTSEHLREARNKLRDVRKVLDYEN